MRGFLPLLQQLAFLLIHNLPNEEIGWFKVSMHYRVLVHESHTPENDSQQMIDRVVLLILNDLKGIVR